MPALLPPRRALAVALPCLLLAASAPAAAAVRYAAPAGTGDCHADDPCDLVTAIADAAGGDTVRVGSGSYALDQSLGNTAIGLTVEAAGRSRPNVSVTTAAPSWSVVLGPAATVRGLDFDLSHALGGGLKLREGATVQDVTVYAPVDGAKGLEIAGQGSAGSTISDVMLSVDGLHSTALQLNNANAEVVHATLLNPSGDALFAATADGVPRTAWLRDSVLWTGSTRTGSGSGADEAIDIDYSALNAPLEAYLGTVDEGPHMLSSGVKISQPDGHELAGSSTIDAGVSTALDRASDFDGDQLWLGDGPDVGADEVPSLATATTGAATGVGARAATLRGMVDAANRKAAAAFEWGTTSAYGHQAAVPGVVTGTAPTAVAAALTGLQPRTTYHYRLVVAGGGSGKDAVFTTPAAPAGPGPATPAPAAGDHRAPRVTRLRLRGRHLRLRLSEPARVVLRVSRRHGDRKRLTRHLGAGTHRVRLPRHVRAVRVVAADAAGNRSAPRTVRR